MTDQLPRNLLITAYVDPGGLPGVPIGYDALDLLVLNELDFAAVDAEQQAAIVSWVKEGGTLLLWPGPDPVPESSPLAGYLTSTLLARCWTSFIGAV